jgi:hypothetical protein
MFCRVSHVTRDFVYTCSKNTVIIVTVVGVFRCLLILNHKITIITHLKSIDTCDQHLVLDQPLGRYGVAFQDSRCKVQGDDTLKMF